MKQMMTQEYQSTYGGIEGACMVELTGMDARSTHAFRGMLRERSMKLRVLKNRIARRAFVDGPLAPLGGYLAGPCALVVGESVIETAKELVEAAKRFPALTLKDGLIEGQTELTPVTELARMKSLNELRADLVTLVLSPGGNVAGVLLGSGGKIAACLQTVIEKLEEGEKVGQSA